MPSVCFVSDLHLFARRSSAELHIDQLVAAANTCDYCVLGGDIFDFRWSTLPSEQATAAAAVEWLHEFNQRTNTCVVHFLMGNHDDHPLLIEHLPELATEAETFEWSRFYYRLGNTLFLHGDVADRTMTAACLEKQRQQFHHGRRSEMHHRLYDMAVKAHLHRITPPAVYPRRKTCKRILAYLEQIGEGPETGVEHVCVGHTHRPIDNYRLGKVTFHNCGAPIGKAPFRIVTREVVVSGEAPTGHLLG
jgi:UDP-2,3-diacylglucosamine pyrophosphatase LpxH